MKTLLKHCFSSLEFGEPQAFRHITILPLLGAKNGGIHYLTLDEALARRVLAVTEISQTGSVPELKVTNSGADPVLLLDGEELAGAKQNRTLNTTILVPAKTDLIVAVSCTEQGRWAYASREFASSEEILEHKIRARKSRSVSASLASSAQYHSDQGEVWDGIICLHKKAGLGSPTHAMSDLYMARKEELARALNAFPLVPGQKGLLVLIGGDVAGADMLSWDDAFARLHPKLVRSYVLDALLDKDELGSERVKAVGQGKVFLEEAALCEVKTFSSTGLGNDLRLKGQRLVGAALVHENVVIHATLFRSEPQERGTNLVAFRRRRRHISGS